MNRIYWDKDKILIVTNQLEAIEHRHCTLQLFFGLEKELNICVAEKDLNSKCILVNQNVNHSFLTGRQHWSKMKNFMYVHFGRKMMNYNVGKIRNNKDFFEIL